MKHAFLSFLLFFMLSALQIDANRNRETLALANISKPFAKKLKRVDQYPHESVHSAEIFIRAFNLNYQLIRAEKTT